MKTSHVLQVGFPRMIDRAFWLGSLGLIAVDLIGGVSLQAQTAIVTYDISTANGANNPSVSPTVPGGNCCSDALTVSGPVNGGTALPPAPSTPGSFLWSVWGAGTSMDSAKYLYWRADASHMNNSHINYTGGTATFSLIFFEDFPGGPHGADTWELHASLDGWGTANDDIPLGSPMHLSTAGQQVPESVPLDMLGNFSGQVFFRLYGYNDTKQSAGADSAGLMNRTDVGGTGGNLVINGTITTPIPEPSSYAAVFGALAFGYVFITHRLRKA